MSRHRCHRLNQKINNFVITNTIPADVKKQAEVTCLLIEIPPGVYDLISVVHQTIWPPVAMSELQVEVVSEPAPVLTISKRGPAIAAPNEVITYTLTITNSGLVSVTTKLVAETLLVEAHYIAGGVRIDDKVRWTIPSLASGGGVTHTTFRVTATETIVNHNYKVRAEGGYTAVGGQSVTTSITSGNPKQKSNYLPTILK